VIGAQRAVQEAQVRIERANTLLELYRRDDPKQAEATTAEPELPATTPKLPQKPKREL